MATIVEYSHITARLGTAAAAVWQRLGLLFRADRCSKVPQRSARLPNRQHRNVGLSAVSLQMDNVRGVWCFSGRMRVAQPDEHHETAKSCMRFL